LIVLKRQSRWIDEPVPIFDVKIVTRHWLPPTRQCAKNRSVPIGRLRFLK
jgi:hypothetical protein